MLGPLGRSRGKAAHQEHDVKALVHEVQLTGVTLVDAALSLGSVSRQGPSPLNVQGQRAHEGHLVTTPGQWPRMGARAAANIEHTWGDGGRW
ncbi:MAG TPA: hypothetical protein VEJ84_15700 [Acidimicrobiales bacterium]|nr:hypothetical protein [Acidimicrobiales bacterium]